MKSPNCIFLFSFFYILTFPIFAQYADKNELPRKGTLGIQMQAAPQGIQVQKVFDHSTASNIGLKEEDLIQTINGQVVTKVTEVVDMVQQWKAQDPISIDLKRNEKRIQLTGTVVGKPFENSIYGQVEYGSVDYDGGQLRTILITPSGRPQAPLLMFMQGIGCGSIDYYYNDQSTVKLLVEEFVRHGVAVLRVEKPGMGDSQNTQACEDMDYPYEVGAFIAALKQAKRLQGVDPNQIFLFGESLSSYSAPLVAAKEKVAGIIVWGGLSKSWFEYSLKLLKDQKFILGRSPKSIEEQYRRNLPFYFDFFVNKKTPQDLLQHPDYRSFAANFFDGEKWLGLHHYSFFHTLNDVDILSAYASIHCPILCLAGDHDVHTTDTHWTKDLLYAVPEKFKSQSKLEIFPQTTHHYYQVPSVQTYMDMRSANELTRAYMAKNFNPDIAEVASKWIKTIIK